MNDYFSSFNQSYHWFEALVLCLTFLSPTLVKVIFFCIADNSKASHQCLMLAKGLDRGHFRQLTHEKDSVLEEEASWGVHSPRVEAKTRNSASGSWRKKNNRQISQRPSLGEFRIVPQQRKIVGFREKFCISFFFKPNQIAKCCLYLNNVFVQCETRLILHAYILCFHREGDT